MSMMPTCEEARNYLDARTALCLNIAKGMLVGMIGSQPSATTTSTTGVDGAKESPDGFSLATMTMTTAVKNDQTETYFSCFQRQR
jgi:hypothetical protein